MNWLRKFRLRFRALSRKAEIDEQMNAELQSHIEMQTAENIELGMSPEEARYAALRSFGWVESIKEACRDQRGVTWIEQFLQDLRYGARSLFRNPGFTAVAVVTLALGIGANTAIFSVVNAVLLRPLPYSQPERVVMLWERNSQLGFDDEQVAPLSVAEWKAQNRIFEEIGFLANDSPITRNLLLESKGETKRIRGRFTSDGFFTVLGVDSLLGRTFKEADNDRKNPCVAILSHMFWQSHFNGDRGVLGHNLKIRGVRSGSSIVVGVMPPGFRFPNDVDLWLSFSGHPFFHPRRHVHDLWVIGRLKPEVTVHQAQVELNTIQSRTRHAHPEAVHLGSEVKIVPLLDQLIGPHTKGALLLLLCAVGFVLLIACTNVANLMLTRATLRQREIAIRTALGAGRGRLLRQLLTEALLMAILGGGAGILLAAVAVKVLPAMDFVSSGGVKDFRSPHLAAATIESVVLGYTFLIAVLTSIASGLVPALQALKIDLVSSIKEHGHGAGPAVGIRKMRSALLVSEVALCLVLLSGTGLMLRSLMNTLRVDPGIRAENVLVAEVDLDAARRVYGGGDRQATTFQIMEQVRRLPFIRSVGAIGELPVQRSGAQMVLLIEGQPSMAASELPVIDERVVTPSFFESLGMRMRIGRDFAESDTLSSPLVAIINETAARRFFPNQNPLGQRILAGHPAFPLRQDRMREIVGVVGDVRDYSLTSEPRPEVYTPYRQQATNNWGGSEIVLPMVFRTTGEPMAIASTLQAAIAGLTPGKPIIENFRPLERLLHQSSNQQRSRTMLMAVFGCAALVLAIVGIYGVFSYFVAQRTGEIGLRLALGAQRTTVLKLILGHGLKLTCLGVLIGIGASLALNRVLASHLVNVSPIDVATLVTVALVLIGAALLACLIPAHRAANISPLTALRHE